MAGHAQLKFVMTECSKTQIRLTRFIFIVNNILGTFVVHCLDSVIPLVSISEISSLYLASVAAQAGLSQPWWQAPKTGFLITRLILDRAGTICIVHIKLVYRKKIYPEQVQKDYSLIMDLVHSL